MLQQENEEEILDDEKRYNLEDYAAKFGDGARDSPIRGGLGYGWDRCEQHRIFECVVKIEKEGKPGPWSMGMGRARDKSLRVKLRISCGMKMAITMPRKSSPQSRYHSCHDTSTEVMVKKNVELLSRSVNLACNPVDR